MMIRGNNSWNIVAILVLIVLAISKLLFQKNGERAGLFTIICRIASVTGVFYLGYLSIAFAVSEKKYNIQDHVITFNENEIKNIANFSFLEIYKDSACKRKIKSGTLNIHFSTRISTGTKSGCVESIASLKKCPDMKFQHIGETNYAVKGIKGFRDEHSPAKIKMCANYMMLEATSLQLKNALKAPDVAEHVSPYEQWDVVPIYEHPAPELSDKLNEAPLKKVTI